LGEIERSWSPASISDTCPECVLEKTEYGNVQRRGGALGGKGPSGSTVFSSEKIKTNVWWKGKPVKWSQNGEKDPRMIAAYSEHKHP